MKPRLLPPRDELMVTMERIYRYRLTTTSGGNLSIRDDTGDIWITPAGVDKGNLRREDMVCVRADGTVEGRHRPSSEFRFHKAIYDARPDLRGICHAHPVALVAFSITKSVPNTRLFHQARHVCGEVGFAPYALPGSDALGRNIAVVFAQGFNCVVLENHGVVTGGRDLQEAFQRFETLEFTGKTVIKAGVLGGKVNYLTDDQIELPRRTVQPLPEFDAALPTTREKELRQQLCDFVRRGYQQRLMISTEGSFSARLGDDAFLITPYQVDRSTVQLDDIVIVEGGNQERGKFASRAARLHRAIYRRHPGIAAILNAYTVNATAFSVTRTPLNSHTIPESYVLLREINLFPYGIQFGDGEQLAAAIAPDRPITLLENDAVLATGQSVLDAFDRLEVLESTAEALINSRPIGHVSPMSAAVIEELRRAFLQT